MHASHLRCVASRLLHQATLSSMTTPQKIARWIEMLALFGGVPVLIWQFDDLLGGPKLFGFLWIMGLICLIGLLFDETFDRKKLWNAGAVMPAMGWIVGRWLILCILLTAAFGLISGYELPGLSKPVPTGIFPIFDRAHPVIPLIIFLFYPWVSVYPQNVICRAFFCHRYRPILGGGWVLVVVNAVAFAMIHIMFNNWIVLVLTFIGGIIFIRTYLKSRSLLLSTIEHAIYGLFCLYSALGIFLLYGASG
ncbi:MAG: CPBP family intramembrane glutamic endopeptidase [Planctomycetota bacterium]